MRPHPFPVAPSRVLCSLLLFVAGSGAVALAASCHGALVPDGLLQAPPHAPWALFSFAVSAFRERLR